MNCVGVPSEAGNVPVILDGKHHVYSGGLVVYFRAANDDQTRASAGSGCVKIHKTIVHLSTGGIIEVHGGHDNPVGQGHGTYVYRFKQFGDQWNLLINQAPLNLPWRFCMYADMASMISSEGIIMLDRAAL